MNIRTYVISADDWLECELETDNASELPAVLSVGKVLDCAAELSPEVEIGRLILRSSLVPSAWQMNGDNNE